MKIINLIKKNIKERKWRFILLLITAILIALSAIIFKTPPLRAFPLFVSLFIMLYQAEANRYAFVAAGINSLIYAAVYYSMGIYASAISSLLFSFPVSMITFFTWSKKAYKKSTVFKKMNAGGRILTLTVSVISWLGIYVFLKLSGSSFAILDNTSTVLSILVTLLTSMAFIEYAYVGLVHIFVALLLKLQLTVNDISNFPYLIYTLYNTTCYVQIFINVRRLYREQNKNKDEIKA